MTRLDSLEASLASILSNKAGADYVSDTDISTLDFEAVQDGAGMFERVSPKGSAVVTGNPDKTLLIAGSGEVSSRVVKEHNNGIMTSK
jgi:hypothetical protein